MKFGLAAPHKGPLASPQALRTIAVRAEQLGFAYLSVSDHIVIPRIVDNQYPYAEDGDFTASQQGRADTMEQFTLLGWLAAVTSRIRLLTSVIVVPHRNPLFMAKSLATTDQLSNGRVVVGCGAGWMREEFEALNLPDFDARGRVTNEYIEAMKVAWTSDAPAYAGEFVQFANIDVKPAPVQRPHPPIWIGGESMPAIRRAVALGDGWYPFGSNPKFRMDRAQTYIARRDKLFAEAEAAGRDPASLELSYNCAFHNHQAQEGVDGQGRQCFTGAPEQRAEDVQAFADAGVRNMMVNVTAMELPAMLERMHEFAENVMPLVDA
jgi:probable F420-dependent oxidoreductase